MRIILFFLFLTLVLLSISCRTRDPDASAAGNVTPTMLQQEFVPPVELIDQDGLRMLTSQRRGKRLLLNVWATWCLPCLEEFPDLIKIAQTDTLIEVIGISVDFPDEMNSKVNPFLKKLRVPFKVYVAKFEKQEDFITAINSTWNGAIPATFIYDQDGKQRSSIVGQSNYDQFKKALKY